jgi:ATP-dependent RNA helicase DDX3X
MSNFDTDEMSNALKDISNQGTTMNAEAAALAREKGWVAPQEYDYAKYTGGESQKPAEGEKVTEELGWASSAAKYEWKEEYGDVGPRNPELEQMLFQNEFISRTGIKFSV